MNHQCKAMAGVLGACLCAASAAAAQEVGPTADKSRYHLLNPTPAALMREMSTDRPDVTESPHTVDAGHVQVELSFAEWTRDGDFDELSVLPTNLKLGLLNNADLQLVIFPYLRQEDAEDVSGFGDTQLRLKLNLWGNDGGTSTALALMPYLSFPTGDDDVSAEKLEGGLIVPLAIDLSEQWTLGLMAEIDVVYDDADDDHDLEFLHTASISRALSDRLGAYLEYIGLVPFESDSDYLAVLGLGMTYGINENTQLDAGVNLGLTDDADDVRIFSGISFRF